VLAIAVERPPWSRGLLTPSEAVALMGWVVAHYHRRFALYKYVCAPVPLLSLTQRFVGDVPEPAPVPALADAILMPAKRAV
jgi:hypothetical protein